MKEIFIGEMLLRAVKERGIPEEYLCEFFGCSAAEISAMYDGKSIDTELLLQWSRLLKYDFFRLYSQHLILYSPQVKRLARNTSSAMHLNFRKNVYSQEVIIFLLEQINSGEKPIYKIVEEYGVPKTTLYKWKAKYAYLQEEHRKGDP